MATTAELLAQANATLDALRPSGRLAEAQAIRFHLYALGIRADPRSRAWVLVARRYRGHRLTWRERHELKQFVVAARGPQWSKKATRRVGPRGLKRFWHGGQLITSRVLSEDEQ